MRHFVMGSLLAGVMLSTGCALLHQPPPVAREATVEEQPHDLHRQYSHQLGYALEGSESTELLHEVVSWLGTPYQMGGCSKEGTDCSCLAGNIYKEVYGIQLPRRSGDIAARTRKVPLDSLKEGDLLFFNITGKRISHVGVHISKGYFVHASASAGVVINHISMAYYAKRLEFAGRMDP